MRRRYVLYAAVSLVVLSGSLIAMPPASRLDKTLNTRTAATIDNAHYINADNILMFITNHGNFGRDLAGVFGNDFGTYYPYHSIEDILNGTFDMSVLYANGLWIGGTVNSVIRMTVAEYSDEYVPGPMMNETFQPDRADFRVYKLYSDSLASNPNDDYLAWPVWQGAPTNPDGTPLMLGDQMLWTVFNDADPNAHDNNAGSTYPSGVEVQLTVWAYNPTTLTGPAPVEGGLIYMKYLLIKKFSSTLTNAYISLWSDPDLGGAGDDLVGCDTVNQVWFCYNGDNSDTQYGIAPPAVGFRLLAGPIVPSSGDTAMLNGVPHPGYRNLTMSSFNAYVNGTDPNDYSESYNYMQGLNADGSAYTYNGLPTKYVHSGDPVAQIGDLDSSPSDRRMMASFGPFDFMRSDTQQLEIVLGVAPGNDRLSSLTALKSLLNMPYPPPPPPCCVGIRGNVTDDAGEIIDIADLIYLVQYAFGDYDPPPCMEEADIDGSGGIDIVDITTLVAYMFRDGPPPVSCP